MAEELNTPEHPITEFTARGFGKTKQLAEQTGQGPRADKAVQDEMYGRAGRSKSVRQGATTRQRQRRVLALWRTRYGKGGQRFDRSTRRAQLNVVCPHAIVLHRQVPHPRYGDRVPHFISWTAPMGDRPHECVAGA